jgi:hypothetical protein
MTPYKGLQNKNGPLIQQAPKFLSSRNTFVGGERDIGGGIIFIAELDLESKDNSIASCWL